jgi:hypothetical protein
MRKGFVIPQRGMRCPLFLPFGKLSTPEGVSGAEGVSQGSSGTDVPAFVNEKRCKYWKERLPLFFGICESDWLIYTGTLMN